MAAALFAAACSESHSPLPTEPPLSPSLTAGRCPSPFQLAALTLALFAPGDLLTFARSTQNNINLKMSKGDITGARKLALAFIDFSVLPAEPFARPVLVVICQAEDKSPLRRQLAHQLPEGKIELLAVVADPFGLTCSALPTFPPSGLRSIGRAVWRFGTFLTR